MYLKYTNGGRNIKKNCINFEKIKYEIFFKYVLISFPFPVIKNIN